MNTSTVLVTGGGGFLGQWVIKKLLKKNYQIRTLNRSSYPQLEELGVTCIHGDLRKYKDVLTAAQGADAVIHVAAKAGVWGPFEEYYDINVKGTENVIAACKELGIQKLVYTSSPSVVFNGEGQSGIDETFPYPEKFLCAYSETKAHAEKLVLNANSPELSTVSLRPHLIWGPGDQHLAPRLIDRYKKNRLRLVGGNNYLVDAVYVENAADAHILALETLNSASKICGKPYFITNHEPWPLEVIVNHILKSAGLGPVTKRVPLKLALIAGSFLEWLYTLLRIRQEPPITRFVAKQLASSHWYSPERSRDELGYKPKISMSAGFKKLTASYCATK